MSEPRLCECGWAPTYEAVWGMWRLRCLMCGDHAGLAPTREEAREHWDAGWVARRNDELEDMG